MHLTLVAVAEIGAMTTLGLEHKLILVVGIALRAEFGDFPDSRQRGIHHGTQAAADSPTMRQHLATAPVELHPESPINFLNLDGATRLAVNFSYHRAT